MSEEHFVNRLKTLDHCNFAVDIVDRWADLPLDLRALLWVDQTGRNTQDLSFRYFSEQSHRAAQLLTDIGIQRGDTLILLLPRIPAWWIIAVAALRAGIVVSPCPTLATTKDICFRANASKAKCLVGDADLVGRLLDVRKDCPGVKCVLQVDGPPTHGAVQYEDLVRKYPPQFKFNGPKTAVTDLAFMFFTSGTSGMPKMVLHNHLYPTGHFATGRHWLMLEPGKLYWNTADQGWAKAAWATFAAWSCGASLFVQKLEGSFSTSNVVRMLNTYPITTLCVAPTAYRRLVLPDVQKLLKEMPPSRLEHCVAAGEALEADLIRAWKDMTGIEIKDGYGQTESPLLCANLPGYPVKAGSMGLPVPGIPLYIVDDDGKECDVGVEGSIALVARDENGKAPVGLLDGYQTADGTKQLDLRRELHPPQGRQPLWWYITGDQASRDEDGYFWFIGRQDDVINSAGYRIGPSEVEAVLQEHPAVLEAAVIASPSAERGEVVKAFIVLNEKARTYDHSALVKSIQDYCKKTAAPYKYPRKIEFVENSFLPRTTSGKIQRAKLRQWEKEKLERSQQSSRPVLRGRL